MALQSLGKSLVLAGGIVVVIGLAIWVAGRVPFLGRLPGDIFVQRGRFSFYFPITTCLIISIVVSLLFRFFTRR